MPKKYICPFSAEELKKLYLDEGRTIEELCKLLGIKSKITASKVLRSHGIDTNSNLRKSAIHRSGMTESEFKTYLKDNYKNGKSMGDISREIGVSPSAIRKYFVKYGIPRAKNTSYFENNVERHPSWKGGRRILSNGYIAVYCPDHPNAGIRKTVYEHQLVMENHIGRYIKKGEVVHHIDGNKSNNDISNLLLLTNSDHVKLHAILKRSAERMKPIGKGDDERV